MAPSPEDDQARESVDVVESAEQAGETAEPGFRVTLGVFDGPFDLLLTLLSKHELDITDVALSTVTAEFIAYLRPEMRFPDAKLLVDQIHKDIATAREILNNES